MTPEVPDLPWEEPQTPGQLGAAELEGAARHWWPFRWPWHHPSQSETESPVVLGALQPRAAPWGARALSPLGPASSWGTLSPRKQAGARRRLR